jgi:hypothetical protein
MSIEVTCSTCRRSFHAPDSAVGKRAKCPSCGGVIDIRGPGIATAAPPSPPPPPEEVYDAIPDDSPASEGNRKACPMCGELIQQSAVKCRYCGEVFDPAMKGLLGGGGDVSDPGWRRVRSGLSNIYYSIFGMIFSIIVIAIAGGVYGGMFAGQNGADMPVALTVIIGICGLAIIAAAIGILVGQLMCAAVPENSGARGMAMGAALCLVVSVLMGMVGGGLHNQAISSLGNVISMVGYILFVLFIKRSAAYLNNAPLAASAGRFLIFGVAMVVGGVALGVIAAIGQAPGILMAVGFAVFVVGLVAFVWYLKLIQGLMKTIDERTRV